VTRLQVKTAPLQEGLTYFARVGQVAGPASTCCHDLPNPLSPSTRGLQVTAINGAGMSSVVQGPPVTIDLSS
jgi:hypothetical protein